MAVSVLRCTRRLRCSRPRIVHFPETSPSAFIPRGKIICGFQLHSPELKPSTKGFKVGRSEAQQLDLRLKGGVVRNEFGSSIRGLPGSYAGDSGLGCRPHITSHGVRRAISTTAEEAGTSHGRDPADGSSETVEGVTVKHKFLSNGGEKIHYVEAGKSDGELVVLLHGWPSFWYCWVYQLKPLVDAGYHVVIPDMRGYNLSAKPRALADYGRQPCLTDVRLLIERSGAGRPAILIAHDWGGAVAWHFVRTYPHLVSRLVTLNIPETTVFGEALKNNKEQRKKSWYMAFFQLPFIPEWLMSRNDYNWLRRALGGSKPRTEELVRRHVDAFSRPGALTASINYYRAAWRGHWTSPGESLGRVDLPVKVIWGEDDVALGKELATPPKELVPDREVVFLPGVSHWCMWDEPERVSTEILNFLAKEST